MALEVSFVYEAFVTRWASKVLESIICVSTFDVLRLLTRKVKDILAIQRWALIAAVGPRLTWQALFLLHGRN